jgi:hypothetical protein
MKEKEKEKLQKILRSKKFHTLPLKRYIKKLRLPKTISNPSSSNTQIKWENSLN